MTECNIDLVNCICKVYKYDIGLGRLYLELSENYGKNCFGVFMGTAFFSGIFEWRGFQLRDAESNKYEEILKKTPIADNAKLYCISGSSLYYNKLVEILIVALDFHYVNKNPYDL